MLTLDDVRDVARQCGQTVTVCRSTLEDAVADQELRRQGIAPATYVRAQDEAQVVVIALVHAELEEAGE